MKNIKMRKLFLTFLLFLIQVTLSFSSCVVPSKNTTTALQLIPGTVSNISTPSKFWPTYTPAKTVYGYDIDTILGLSENINEISYYVLTTGMDKDNAEATMVTQVWVKNNKIRLYRESRDWGGFSSDVIIDISNNTIREHNLVLEYDAKYRELYQSVREQIQSIKENVPKVVGLETIENQICLVIEYGEKTRTWLSVSNGLILRTVYFREGNYQPYPFTSTEYHEYNFNSIPEYIFQF